ncbi:MAG: amidohydrolase [Planctomycetota bacterium]|nr:MAG: amidohydrolase [Planctomycetota bacterium]
MLHLLALLLPSEPEVTAFVDVRVIPMDRERVLEHQTVLVRGDRIARVGPAAEVAVPEGARRIDGAGRTLVPGLTDMHAHFLCDFGFQPDARVDDEMFLMLGNGVTTARLMIGRPEHLQWRREIDGGARLGPRLFVASPQFSGRRYGDPHFNGVEVKTPEAAAAAVRQCKKDGYDCIKLTFFISRPVYDAVVATAREEGIRVVGHVGHDVGLPRALEAGQQVEHLDEFLEMLLPEPAGGRTSVSGMSVWDPRSWPSVDHLDASRIPAVAEQVVQAGIWNTPTLFYLDTFGVRRSREEIQSWPWYRFFTPDYVQKFEDARLRFLEVQPSDERAARFVALRRAFVKALWEHGGKLMAGSDAPELFCLYGFTLHREIQTFVEAGLTPYAALETATRNPAEWLGIAGDAGTIAEGRRADLVLAEGNPLDDLRRLERPVGVRLRGRWIPRDAIETRFDAIAAAFQAGS